MKAVFFFAGSKKIGLTSHFTNSTVDLYKNATEYDFYIVSDSKEQNEGLWAKLEIEVPSQNIIKYNEINYGDLTIRLENIIKKYDKIVFHFQGFEQILKTKSLLKKYKDKVSSVVTIHSFANGTWKRGMVSYIYSIIILRYINKVIFLSPFAWNHFTNSKKLFRKGKILHIPFNLPKFEALSCCDDNILSPDDFNIVYLANFTKNKRHEFFLDGIIKFVIKYPDVKIYFFGEGERLQQVKKRIEKLNLQNNIACPGRIHRDKIFSVLNKTDIGLVLSASENAGHCLIEPMMLGVPVISSRVGSGEYLIQDGINAIGINTSDDLFLGLDYLYNNQAQRKEMGESAKQIVADIFDYQKMIKAYSSLYSRL